ncbi:MAG TPA: Fic family protein [Anaeromyxobacteraceae bacterium]|nr:Fic family protein [Anaeromyxobacteraceae bacterium]
MRTRYVDIDDRHEDLAERMRAQPEQAEDFLRKWEVSWLYHENALEGVVYTSQELELALDNQPVADAAFVGALRDIRNHKTALDLVREEARAKKLKLNLSMVKKLYETLGAGVEGRSVAEWRRDMPLHRTYYHEIAQPARILPALQKVFEACESTDFKNAHPIHQATRLHHGFMQVFPFTENSGRVARLFANLILFQAGYLPVIIHATDRQRYYDAFRQPEASLRDLTMDAIENGLAHAEKLFSHVEKAGKHGAKKLVR